MNYKYLWFYREVKILGREDDYKPLWKSWTNISKLIKELEKKWKNHYNVYVYFGEDYYPTLNSEEKNFIIDKYLIRKI